MFLPTNIGLKFIPEDISQFREIENQVSVDQITVWSQPRLRHTVKTSLYVHLEFLYELRERVSGLIIDTSDQEAMELLSSISEIISRIENF